MNNNQPVLHLSLYVDCSPSQKRELRKLLSDYIQRIDQWSPVVDISIDSYEEHMEKQVQQEMLYDSTQTLSIQKSLPTVNQIYMANVIITSYALQRLYEDNPNSRAEGWMFLSFTHSGENQYMYNIELAIGYES
ncbi:hypothetical protein [Clostridium kluyveri]|uniref:Uncharacterized protein n=1 Tax=Clostridium kluyveri TaxID=1534 RepID=A0A1L5FAC1_CLOKL|nr:hypothetical protein [Clostridium kluyveri]APM39965.1 hypothetical protein BS101_15100 [Clostridium kluyveri]